MPPPESLRIALLAYRGKPHVGGQGVYVRHLSKALCDLGHHVEVFGGQPYPELDERVALHELPSLDIYNEHFPMRMPGIWELKSWADWVEVTAFSTGTFPEPLAFSVRAWDALRHRYDDFDLVHDNQSLGYGLLAIQRDLPVLSTVHHPITVDRRLEMEHAKGWWERFSKQRWYAFTRMQTHVASRIERVVTVSENSREDIIRDHQVKPERIEIVPVGVDPELFRPLDDVARVPGRLITTASADVAMKGLTYLLEALAKVRTERPDTHLVVIGRPKPGGSSARTIEQLGLEDAVEFVSGVPEQRIIELYSEAQLAVVPSLYEGFSLPAIEAMSCGVPLLAPTGGAQPEVAGEDRETPILGGPGDSAARAGGLRPVRAADRPINDYILADAKRVIDHWSWVHTAKGTVEQYQVLLEGRAARSGDEG